MVICSTPWIFQGPTSSKFLVFFINLREWFTGKIQISEQADPFISYLSVSQLPRRLNYCPEEEAICYNILT